jgi:hypothetical protein
LPFLALCSPNVIGCLLIGMQHYGWQAPADTSWHEVTRRALCPRCGADRAVDYGAQVGCGRCGACWQADAHLVVELPPPRATRRRRDELTEGS